MILMGSTKFSAIILFFLVLFVSAQSNLDVPAVSSSGGGMMTDFQCRAVQGSGGVYVDVEPFVSVDTQDSAKQAVQIAAKQAGVNHYKFDVLYHIVADAEIVDGPSAGAALALLAYAELSGRPLRQDLAVTGSIERDGSIGRISGVRRKLEAVGDAGLALFIIPRGQIVQGGVDLSELGQRMGVQVVEAGDFQELVAYAFTPEGEKVNASAFEPPPLDPYALETKHEDFKQVVELEMEALRDRLPSLDASSKELALDALNESSKLLEKGYHYSAANELFLSVITIETRLELANQNLSKTDFKALLDSLEADLKAFQPNNKSFDNFELVAGAQARVAWAENELQALRDDYSFYGVEALLGDYVSARAWLDAAHIMNDVAGRGQGFQEFKLRDYALKQVEKANASAESSLFASLDFEVGWHLEGARKSFSEGAYAAAVFDACFVNSFVEANELLDETVGAKELSELVNGAEDVGDYSNSLWAELYYAHSLYNWQEGNRTNDYDYKVNAVKLQRLANCLAVAERDLESEAQKPVSQQSGEAPQPSFTVEVERAKAPAPESAQWFFFSALLFLVGGVVFMVLTVRHNIKKKRGGHRKHLTQKKRLELLDDLLLEGKIGERTYKRLRKKYSKKRKR